MPLNLNDSNAVDYLASQGLVKSAEVKSVELLGGGVSNTLVRVCTADDCLVVKQSLPQLRVAEHWPADRERIFRERAAIDILAGILPPDVIPRVIYEDRESYLFVMSCAPSAGVNWKEQLLVGEVNQRVVEKAGATLGLIHRMTANVESVPLAFLDHRCFIQLRIDPYHRATARAHPYLAGVIEREAQRMLGVRAALVHGDYSPKNFIVTGADIFLLDFEVVHYGNPVFDLAFMVNHLFLKSVYNAPIRREYFQAVGRFWERYIGEVAGGPGPSPDWAALEWDTVRQLGCLMLARIDGKSPAEYIIEPEARDLVRGIARSILLEDLGRLSQVVDLVDSRLA